MKKFIMLFTVIAILLVAKISFAEKAVAYVKGTSEDSKITGEVWFTEAEGGLDVNATLSNAAPVGLHGFHVHAYGSCEDGGNAAGGHYNPHGTDHGLLARDGYEKAHAGDMGNIEAKEDGSAVYKAFIPGLSVGGSEHNVAGRAVILHAQVDDFGQPTGNAGGRIGCGTIIIVPE